MGRGPSDAEIARAKRRALTSAAENLGGRQVGEWVHFTRYERQCTATVRPIRASNGEVALVKVISDGQLSVESVFSSWDTLYWELRNKQIAPEKFT